MALTDFEHHVIKLKSSMELSDINIAKATGKTIEEVKEIIVKIILKLKTDYKPEWMICVTLNITPDEISEYLDPIRAVEPPKSQSPPSPEPKPEPPNEPENATKTRREIELESKVMYLEFKINQLEEQFKKIMNIRTHYGVY